MRRRLLLLFIVLALILGSAIPAFALGEVYSGGYPASVVSGLKYIISGSPGTWYDDDIIHPAAYDWNFISTKVSVTYNSSGSKMSVLVQDYSGSDVVGRMIPYYRNILGRLVVDTTCTKDWEVTEAIGYDETMNDNLYLSLDKRHVYCHEIGHALSLDHVTADADAIMKQGSRDPVSPTDYDKANLRFKWGN